MEQNEITSVRADEAVGMLCELQRFLEATCRDLDVQIRAYPTPIPRCDAQFNHLYAQRACALRELDVVRSQSTPETTLRELGAQWLQHEPYGDSEVERRIRACLQAMRSQGETVNTAP